jgi:hypothetical protein
MIILLLPNSHPLLFRMVPPLRIRRKRHSRRSGRSTRPGLFPQVTFHPVSFPGVEQAEDARGCRPPKVRPPGGALKGELWELLCRCETVSSRRSNPLFQEGIASQRALAMTCRPMHRGAGSLLDSRIAADESGPGRNKTIRERIFSPPRWQSRPAWGRSTPWRTRCYPRRNLVTGHAVASRKGRTGRPIKATNF